MSDPLFLTDVALRAAKVITEAQADVLLYSGPMDRPFDDAVIHRCKEHQQNEHLMLVLCTGGGDANAAYRIARFAQKAYSSLSVLINGFCKSAGTLVTLGADEVVMSDFAELGPLDVQLRNIDDPDQTSSGLTIPEALASLQSKAYESFVGHLVEMKDDLDLTTKVAATIASELTVGLFAPVYAQIDPVRLGEMDRATRIALQYGERLSAAKRNLKDGSLVKLVSSYPSHGFVIDRLEAEDLFVKVRAPTASEVELTDILPTRVPVQRKEPFIYYMSPLVIEEMLNEEQGPDSPGGGDTQADKQEDGVADNEGTTSDPAAHVANPEGTDAN